MLETKSKGHEMKPSKYQGPAKPIPTHVELISDRAERIIFLLFAIFLATYLFLE